LALRIFLQIVCITSTISGGHCAQNWIDREPHASHLKSAAPGPLNVMNGGPYIGAARRGSLKRGHMLKTIIVATLRVVIAIIAIGGSLSADDNHGGKGGGSSVITGPVQSLPAGGLQGIWTISGNAIQVTSATQVVQSSGPVAIGSCVQVFGAGQTYYGTTSGFTATEIDVISAAGGCSTAPVNQQIEVEFFGAVQSFPASLTYIGDWNIAGRIVHATAAARLDISHTLAVGACAEVRGLLLSDASVEAERIQIDDDAGACAAGIVNVPAPRFLGTVSSLPSTGLLGTWIVSGRTVTAASTTEVQSGLGAITTGSCVSVAGTSQADSSILASEIDAEPAAECGGITQTQGLTEIEGTVQEAPAGLGAGKWQIANRTVRVSASTSIDSSHGQIAIGSCVEATGSVANDGALLATSIESLSASGTCVPVGGVVSAASFAGGAVSPGQLVSIFGLNIGTPDQHGASVKKDGHIDDDLANVSVFFDGRPAPLLLVTAGQINTVVPFEVSGKPTTTLQVQNNGVWSNPVVLNIAPALPAFFTLTQTGKGQVAALDVNEKDGSVTVNGASNPSGNAAARGSIVTFYATGGGMGDAVNDDGLITGSQLSHPQQKVRLSIGGADAEVLYAGSAPGLVAGVLQINARVPNNVAAGAAVPVVLTVGDHSSPDGTTLAVK
jgi:uncharacterized protein (TIGR03437 family)